jgi:hypothetical protein
MFLYFHNSLSSACSVSIITLAVFLDCFALPVTHVWGWAVHVVRKGQKSKYVQTFGSNASLKGEWKS